MAIASAVGHGTWRPVARIRVGYGVRVIVQTLELPPHDERRATPPAELEQISVTLGKIARHLTQLVKRYQVTK